MILSVLLRPVSSETEITTGLVGAAVSIVQMPSEVGEDWLPATSVAVMLKG